MYMYMYFLVDGVDDALGLELVRRVLGVHLQEGLDRVFLGFGYMLILVVISPSLSLSIYIYIYTRVCIYIYIYMLFGLRSFVFVCVVFLWPGPSSSWASG